MSTYEREFFCKRDNLNIRCRQYFPEGFDEKIKYPAVITCHGFTGNVFGTAEFCRGFAKMDGFDEDRRAKALEDIEEFLRL